MRRPISSTRQLDVVDVRGQQLAELVGAVLGAALGVEGAAAVAHADVEPAVRPEGEVAAVVVGLRLGDVQQLAGLPAVAELGDARVAALVGPVEVEPPVGREVGVEGEPEQALLGADRDLAGEVDHRGAATPLARAPRGRAARAPTAQRDRRARRRPRSAGSSRSRCA